MAPKAIKGMIVGIGIVVGLGFSWKPWRKFTTQRKETQISVSKQHSSENAREEAVRREAKYSGPIGREIAAREAGWIKPGEEPADK